MHTASILLGAVALLGLPLLAAYWVASYKATQAHLDLLCERDQRNSGTGFARWKRLERMQFIAAAAFFVLLLVWGAVQVYLGPEGKSTLDWLFTWMYAAAFVPFVLVGHHYNFEDLLNSMGLGERAERRARLLHQHTA